MSSIDTADYGLTVPQPYLFGWPEELPANAASPVLAASILAFTGQGRLVGFTITNTNASAQFVQMFNATSLPADTTVPLLAASVPGAGTLSLNWGPDGRWFTRGLVLCNSSTQGTKTIGAADCLFDVQYVPQRQ